VYSFFSQVPGNDGFHSADAAPYAQKFRIPVEEENEAAYKNVYLKPEAYNLPYNNSFDYIERTAKKNTVEEKK